MKTVRVCHASRSAMAFAGALAISACVAACSVAHAAPDLFGIYWATTYSPSITMMGAAEPPLNAAGKAAYEKNRAGLKDGSVVDKARRVCVPDGLPRVLATPYPFEIFQVPVDQVVFVYEMNHQSRVIFMDRPLPEAQKLLTEPLYNGYSVGHWEGDALVVESAGFNDRTFLDATGLPHTDEMRTSERIRKLGDQLEIVITIHDPDLYEHDWQARYVYEARSDVRVEEYACNETHRDLSGIKGVQRR